MSKILSLTFLALAAIAVPATGQEYSQPILGTLDGELCGTERANVRGFVTYIADLESNCWFWQCLGGFLIPQQCPLGAAVSDFFSAGSANPCAVSFNPHEVQKFDCTRKNCNPDRNPPCFNESTENNTCQNGGSIAYKSGICWCVCPAEWQGDWDCSKRSGTTPPPSVTFSPDDPFECTEGVECFNGGICSRGEGNMSEIASCQCLPGYSGLMLLAVDATTQPIQPIPVDMQHNETTTPYIPMETENNDTSTPSIPMETETNGTTTPNSAITDPKNVDNLPLIILVVVVVVLVVICVALAVVIGLVVRRRRTRNKQATKEEQTSNNSERFKGRELPNAPHHLNQPEVGYELIDGVYETPSGDAAPTAEGIDHNTMRDAYYQSGFDEYAGPYISQY